jgi:hypothetical protein
MSLEREQLFESIKQEFLTVPDSVALAELIERAPFMCDDDFLATVEQWLVEAETAEGWDVAAGLRERLDVLRELANPSESTADWPAALEAFAGANTTEELIALARDLPLVREPAFHTIVEQLIAHAEASGEQNDAQALRLRLTDLQQITIDEPPGVTLATLLGQMASTDLYTTSARESDPALLEDAERQALALLRHLSDQQQLLALVGQAPFVLDDTFLVRVEQALAAAEAAGDTAEAGGLRARLEGLRMIKTQVQITLPQTLAAFASVADGGEMLALTQRAPFVLDDSFLSAVERTIQELDDGGGDVEAEGLRVRLSALRQLRDQRDLAQQSPVMQALLNFLNAHDDAAAEAIYTQQQEQLNSDEAQQTLETAFAGGDPESQRRIEERRTLLQAFRLGTGTGV